MSWYSWKFWRLAWSRNRGGENIDMGPTHFYVWRHVTLGFWWNTATLPHGGIYWAAVEAWRQKGKR